MKTIKLHGSLGKKFGKVHRLDVKSPAEAVRALSVLHKGFEKEIREGYWQVTTRRKGSNKKFPVSLETVDMNIGSAEEIHFTPKPAVAGIELIIIGGLALFAVAAAVFALSAIPPTADDPNDRQQEQNGFLFDGPVNVTEQGHPVPLVYGKVKTGSIVASAGLETTDFNSSTLPSNGWGLAGGGSTGGWDRDALIAQVFKGGKGGGSQDRSPDDQSSLNSESIARILDVIIDGEWEPALPGLQWVEFDEVPVEGPGGSYNGQGVWQPGPYNHSGVSIETSPGLPDQDYIIGHGSQESTVAVDTEVSIQSGAIERTISDPDVTRARVAIRLPGLSQRDPEDGALKRVPTSGLTGQAPRIRILVQSSGTAGFNVEQDYSFSGLAAGPYLKDFNVNLPEGGAPWIIRVERMTPDSTDSLIQNGTEWNTITSVIDAKLRYPNTGLVGLTVSARQFGSKIPRRGYFIKGAKIQVPTNYDPETRVYTGEWDGTFKKSWTDNPVWVYYDLVTNTRYGLGKFLKDKIDKWGLYSIAQYCDGMVDDGFGGQEPRFTCNLVINKRDKAYKVLNALASSFRAISFWAHNEIQLVQDAPTSPDVLVGPSNVVGGTFKYSGGVERVKKFSQFVITWNDPAEGYRQNYEIVEDEELLRQIGPKPTTVAAYGCTSRGQARRLGLWMREDQKYNGGVEYTAGPDHSFVPPGRIAKINDPDFVGARWTGRAVNENPSTNSITLDAPVTLEAAPTYSVSIVMPDGSVEVREITNSAGTTSTLTFAPLPVAPVKYAVWSLESSAVVARQFRISRVKEKDEDEYQVSAGLFDPNKFARVEQGLMLDPANYTGVPTGPLKAPNSISVEEFVHLDGDSTVPSVLVGWEPANDPRVTDYEAQVQLPGSNDFIELLGGETFNRVFVGVEEGDYIFRVRSKNGLGQTGPWRLSVSFDLDGPSASLPEVTNLNYQKDNAALTTTLTWLRPVDVRPFKYQILKNSTNDLASAEEVGKTSDHEFTVSGVGFYWVRTTYIKEVSPNPPVIDINPAALPEAAGNLAANGARLSDFDPLTSALIDALPTEAEVAADIQTARNYTDTELAAARIDITTERTAAISASDTANATARAASDSASVLARSLIQGELDQFENDLIGSGGRVVTLEDTAAEQATSLTSVQTRLGGISSRVIATFDDLNLWTLGGGLTHEGNDPAPLSPSLVVGSVHGPSFFATSNTLIAKAYRESVSPGQSIKVRVKHFVSVDNTNSIPDGPGLLYAVREFDQNGSDIGGFIFDNDYSPTSVADGLKTSVGKYTVRPGVFFVRIYLFVNRTSGASPFSNATHHIVSIETETNTEEEALESSIISLQTTKADATALTVEATRIDTLNSTVGDAQSDITSLQTTKADATALTAEATRIDTLNSTVGDVQSDITSLQTTKADASALTTEATRIDTLNSTVGGVQSDITTLQMTKADLSALTTEAARIDDLVSVIEGTASITYPSDVDADRTFFTHSVNADPNNAPSLSTTIFVPVTGDPNFGNCVETDGVSLLATSQTWSLDITPGARLQAYQVVDNSSEDNDLDLYARYFDISNGYLGAKLLGSFNPSLTVADGVIDETIEGWTHNTTLGAAQWRFYMFCRAQNGGTMRIKDFEILFAESGGLESRITTLETTKADASALTAEATRIDTLSSDVGTAQSDISTLQTTKADASALTAEAARIDTLSSDVGTAQSDITTLQTTKADASALTAETTRIDNLVSDVGTAQSDISTLQTTKADASALTAEAARIDTLTSTVGSNTGDIASLQTTIATNEQATATSLQQLSATLDALSGLPINDNSDFDDWTNSAGMPAGWATFGTGTITRQTGEEGAYAIRVQTPANGFGGFTQTVDLDAEPYTFKVKLKGISSNLNDCGIWLRVRDAADGTLATYQYLLQNHPDVDGVTSSSISDFREWEFSIPAVDNADNALMRYYGHFDTANRPANTIEIDTFELAGVDPTTAEVSFLQQALSDGTGNYARAVLNTSAGAGRSFIEIGSIARADGTIDSDVGLGGRRVEISTTDGSAWYKAMDVVGTTVTVYGDLDALGAMRFGTRRIPVALQSFSISNLQDNDTISFGGDLTNIPEYEFSTTGLDPLAAGEEYDLALTSLTATGAIVRAEIIGGGSSTAYSDGGSTNGSGAEPDKVLHKGNAADSANGDYSFTLNITSSYSGQPGEGFVAFDQLEFFVRSAGVWISLGTEAFYDDSASQNGNFTVNRTWTKNFTGPIGQTSDQEYGVSSLGGDIVSINSFTVNYSSTSAGTTRTATPGGRRATVRIIPKNG